MKEKIESIRSLSPLEIVIVISLFTATAAGGSLLIFLFDKEMFLALDNIKLILLSFSVTIPIMFVNVFFSSVILNPRKGYQETAEDFKVYLAVSGITTTFSVYIPLVLRYFLGFSFGWFIFLLMLINFSIFVFLKSLE